MPRRRNSNRGNRRRRDIRRRNRSRASKRAIRASARQSSQRARNAQRQQRRQTEALNRREAELRKDNKGTGLSFRRSGAPGSRGTFILGGEGTGISGNRAVGTFTKDSTFELPGTFRTDVSGGDPQDRESPLTTLTDLGFNPESFSLNRGTRLSVKNKNLPNKARKSRFTGERSFGKIEESARARLAEQGIRGSKADEAIEKGRVGARDTLTFSGLGASFDPGTGRVDPSTLPDGTKVNKEFKGTTPPSDVDVTTTETNIGRLSGATTSTTTTDQKGGDSQDGVGGLGGDPSGYLNSLLPEQQQAGGDLFDPLFQAFAENEDFIRQQEANGMSAIEALGGALQQYISQQQSRDNAMTDQFNSFYKSQLDNQLAASDTARDAQRRDLELAKREAEFEFDTAIRDQQIQNEKDRKDQFLGLGISGGWRSSRHSADVIAALKIGERIVADLRVKKGFMTERAGNKLSDVEADWYSSREEAHDAYRKASLDLLKESNTRASAMDKVVYNSTKDRINAVAGLKESIIKQMGDNAMNFAKTVVDRNKFHQQQALEIMKFESVDRARTVSEMFKYIDVFGTAGNSSQLRAYEAALGLVPGSLSDRRTLAELKSQQSGGKGVAEIVQFEVNDVMRSWPGATEEEAMSIAWKRIGDRFGSGQKGGEFMQNVKYYLRGDFGYHGSLPELSAGAADDARTQSDLQGYATDRWDIATGIKTPSDVWKELRSNDFTVEEANEYMRTLGYPRTDRFFRPSFE